MKKIGIIGAMEVEVTLLQSNMKDITQKESGSLQFFCGELNGVDVVVVRSGIGKVNAALCAQRLVTEFGVTHIINTGIAGAMAEGLGVLDFVVSTDALYHDFDTTGFGYKPTQIPQMAVSDFEADPTMIEAAVSAFSAIPEAKGHKVVKGRVASGDQFISDKQVKQHIKDICNPACVEMEGAAIAHACYINKTPFLIIRCMSDTASENGESLYEFNEKIAAELCASMVMEIIKKL